MLIGPIVGLGADTPNTFLGVEERYHQGKASHPLDIVTFLARGGWLDLLEKFSGIGGIVRWPVRAVSRHPSIIVMALQSRAIQDLTERPL